MFNDLGFAIGQAEVDYEAREVAEPIHPSNIFLSDYISARSDARGIAHRRDINPVDLRKIMGGITIIESAENGANLRYRLVGVENEQRLGIKLNGRLFTECYGARMAAEQLAFINDIFKNPRRRVLQGRFLGLELEHAWFEAIYHVVQAESGDLQVFTGMYEIPIPHFFE